METSSASLLSSAHSVTTSTNIERQPLPTVSRVSNIHNRLRDRALRVDISGDDDLSSSRAVVHIHLHTYNGCFLFEAAFAGGLH